MNVIDQNSSSLNSQSPNIRGVKMGQARIFTYSPLLNWTHVGIIRNGIDLQPMGFLLDVIFHFCPPMGTIKTMVFHLSTSWVLLGPWFSVFPENSQAGSTVQKHVWYYWDHGFSFKHPMGTIRTMVFCLSHMWVLLRTWFSKKHSNCCYSTHGFNSAGKSRGTSMSLFEFQG